MHKHKQARHRGGAMVVHWVRMAAMVLAAWLWCGGAVAAPPKNAAPTVTLTSPSNGATFAAPATVTLSANATDSDGTISKVEFFRGTTLIAAVTVAPYQYSWTSVAAGSYSITARATDNGGATATSAAASITVGGSPGGGGGITITSPTATTSFPWQATDVSGTFTGTADTTILVSNGANSTVLGALTGATTYTARNLPLDYGTNIITATAIRRDGTSSTASVTVDLPQKLVAIMSPANGASFDSPPSLTLEAAAVMSSGSVQRVEYHRAFAGLLGSATAPPYSYVWTNPPAGNHQLQAFLVDEAGRSWLSQVVNITVNVPNAPPAVNLTAPANGAVFTAPATVQLQAAASDTDGTVSQVEFFQNGALLGSTNVTPYAMSVGSLGQGSYTFSARATDNRGGTATSAAAVVSVTAPNTAPSIALTSPAAGAGYLAPAEVVLAATASDRDGAVAKVEFHVGSTLIATATAAPYTASWSATAAGTYTFTAKAYDNHGLSTVSAPVTVNVGDGVTYLHNDFAGTPMFATDSGGAVLWKENHRPYGEKLNNPPAAAGSRLSFHGKALDAETGLAYFGARYYDPVLGRFMGVDAVGFMEDNLHSFNRYAYGNNSPQRHVDPDGNQPVLIFQENPVISIDLGPRLIEPAHRGTFAAGAPPSPSGSAHGGGLRGSAASVGNEGLAAKGGLPEARVARDALAAELAPLKGKAPATVTGGYNTKTGEVAARACGGGKCAEDHVFDALGRAKGDVRFTEAIRPRTGAEVPVCARCEASFGREPFPRNTRFKTDE
jgi:RHS repeat-associated protein